MKYIKRNLEITLEKYLKIFSVIGITGPRQSGKSTMLKHVLGDKYTYITFDDINIVNFFHNDPVGFMETYNENVIFDEVQYAPELFRYVKIAVDKNRDKKGNYILTGSAQFSFMKNVTESLAGRIGLLKLLPFEYSELLIKFRNKSMYLGGYPELSRLNYNNFSEWFMAYINTYLERDVRALSNIGDLRDFSVFLKLLAAKHSQILNLTDLSKDVGVAVNTVKKWLSILEASYIVFLLPPFYNNLGKRLIKRPKLYFYDTGLVSYLIGIENKSDFDKSPFSGHIFENYVISEIMKKSIHSGINPEMYYLRTSDGKEVDLILQQKNNLQFIEIKHSSTFKTIMVKNIEDLMPDNARGYLIYSGSNIKYKNKIDVINYDDFLKL